MGNLTFSAHYRAPALDEAQRIIDEVGNDDDNRRRAARALLAVSPAYEDAPKDALCDFLADALHLCDLAGWNFAEIEKSARRNYSAEVVELGAAKDPALARAIQEE